MKRRLGKEDAIAAVWGGAVLGGGGGGHIEAGLETAVLAIEAGPVVMVDPEDLDDRAMTATVALVGSPSNPESCVYPAHALRAFELLRASMGGRDSLAAIHTNENGPETSINGWFTAAVSGLPLLNLACNGRAHPTGAMGSMGLHAEPGYVSRQALVGGAGERYIEACISGRLSDVAAMVIGASERAGGFVTVCRNPVQVGFARANGAPGAIGQAIHVGRAYLHAGLPGVLACLSARVVAEGVVRHYACERLDGLDVGVVELNDRHGTTLRFVNEYMSLEQDGVAKHYFPELICTFVDGQPTVSARIEVGARVQVVVAPTDKLILSPTMWMKELYLPVERLLGRDIPLDMPRNRQAAGDSITLLT